MPEYVCPHCKKPIYDEDALLCLYCAESLNRGVGFIGKLKYSGPKKIFVFVAVLVVLSLFLLTIF
ncbi:MAG: hypothetical protein ABIH19_04600 [Candidatus Omnitrophota bacterium]